MLDKLSHKILTHISKQKVTLRQDIISVFGENAQKSIDFLMEGRYIKSGQVILEVGHNMAPKFGSDGKYSITSLGLAYLQEKPGKDFDRWLTRIVAIWGAITGTAALVLELVLHFL